VQGCARKARAASGATPRPGVEQRAKVNGERWQLNNKNDKNLQKRWISLMKNGDFFRWNLDI
jgi:hypothetical protein